MKKETRNRDFAILLSIALLTGCASQSGFVPASVENGYGYSDRELPDGRYEVAFVAGSETPDELMSDYLLLRMAEIAKARGAERFTGISEKMDCVSHLRVSPDTVCEVRQSSSAMFPYLFSEDQKRGIFGTPSLRQHNEALALFTFGGATPCHEAELCYETSSVLEHLSYLRADIEQ